MGGRWAVSLLLLLSCAHVSAQGKAVAVRIDTLTLLDTARVRSIPVAFYSVREGSVGSRSVVLLSHGYNENEPGTYLKYSYLSEFLAERGYFVVSIQHELPGDEQLAMQGDLRTLRRPNWERGVRNILHVVNHLKATRSELDFKRTTLIGHSNGGDMSVLFAEQYPDLVENLITLDNRRLPLPRADKPRVLSLRSSDAPPDEGVLPTREEELLYDMRIVPLNTVRHNEMSDRANDEQREAIKWLVLGFLEMADDH